MECSFCIWIARNSKTWDTNQETNRPLVQMGPVLSKAKQNVTPPKKELKQQKALVSPTATKTPKGFINKDNTCYANSILQALSVLPLIWCKVPSETSCIPPLLKSISLNMTMKEHSKRSAIDPSNFL